MVTGRLVGLVAVLGMAVATPAAVAAESASSGSKAQPTEAGASLSRQTAKPTPNAIKLRGPKEILSGKKVPLLGKVRKTKGDRLPVKIQLSTVTGWKRIEAVRTNRRGKFRIRVAVASMDTASFRATAKLKRRNRFATSKTVTVTINQTDTPTDSPSSSPKTPPTKNTGNTPTPTKNSSMSEQELRMVKLVNNARAAGRACGQYGYFPAVPPLQPNDKLAKAALVHSDDMATNDFFTHTSANGDQPSDRINRQGYRWSSWGENIAAGYPDAADATKGLLNSPGHCKNIMDSGFTEIGVGVATSDSDYGIYWTQNFGSPRIR